MTIWIAMLLGLVQGLCEFLPVSSSGHLLLLQNMFGITEGALFFTVMLHLGTLVAVFIAYWKTIVELIKHPLQKTVLLLVIATVPAVVVALLSKKIDALDAFFHRGGDRPIPRLRIFGSPRSCCSSATRSNARALTAKATACRAKERA